MIEGLINLRGQIVTAIDMRRRLRFLSARRIKPPMNVVVRTSDGAVSLLVDEIGDVLQLDESAYERPPENLDGVARELIRGVYKLKDRLLLVLDRGENGRSYGRRVGSKEQISFYRGTFWEREDIASQSK